MCTLRRRPIGLTDTVTVLIQFRSNKYLQLEVIASFADSEACLGNLDDDLIICDGGEWLHYPVHFSKNGIGRRQGNPVTLVHHLHGGFFS